MVNPDWPETTRDLLSGQLPQDRPDIALRVFMMMLQTMISYLIDEKLFDNIGAYLQVVEFSKGCLPHLQCNAFLDEASKQRRRCPKVVDELVGAEMPSTQNNELQFSSLKRYIHTPCGPISNLSAVCLKINTCQKYFAKQIVNEASSTEGDCKVAHKRRLAPVGVKQVNAPFRIGF